MPATMKGRGMTHGRTVLLVLALLLAAQGALITIGLYYGNSIYKNIQSQRFDIILDQFEQNMTQQLNGVDDLMLLLQMPDINFYFTDYMNLRDENVAGPARASLLKKMRELDLSAEAVDSVYIIGGNINQKAHRIAAGSADMEDLPSLRLDSLHYSKLENLFLRNNDQFVRYGAQDLLKAYDPDSAILSPSEIAETDGLLENLKGRIVLTDSYKQVFTILVLSDRLFSRALPEGFDEQAVFSVLRSDSEMLWSSSGSSALLASVARGDAATTTQDGTYTNTRRNIQPFNLTIVCSRKQTGGMFLKSDLLGRMLLISLCTLTAAFLFNYLALRFVFKPFRRFSRKFGSKQGADAAGWLLLPEGSINNRFHAISLRSKLIMLFCITVSMLVCANGILFSRLLNREVDYWAGDSVHAIGDIGATGICNAMRFYENLANQVSASRQFQDYLADNNQYPFGPYEPLTTSPGWNGISYLLLLDKLGNSIYSTIYSNNNQMFYLASMYVRDVEAPYWILYYNGIEDGISTAVVRKAGAENSNGEAWILIVPKADAFSIRETERIKAKITITNSENNVLFTHSSIPAGQSAGLLHYQKQLPGPGWKLTIDYQFSDIAAMKQSYQEKFIFSIVIVFLLSAGMVIRISTMLTRPIMRLRAIMQASEADGVARYLDYDRDDEVGGIIHSYNRMIAKLEETTRENMRIMEENALNKIRENELLSLKTRAEMNMLQAQINPHFLHNTLTTINMQSLKHGDGDTSRMVSALADLLRYSISVSADTASLQEEIKHASNYITIQQIRFGNSFEGVFDVPDETLGCTVLRFVLQPIIENSIKHGFEGWDSGGLVTVTVRRKGGALSVSILDNGVGMDDGTLARLRSELKGNLADWKTYGGSIGLKNVYHRLKLHYGENMKMEISSGLMKGTEVYMEFPTDGGAGEERIENI